MKSAYGRGREAARTSISNVTDQLKEDPQAQHIAVTAMLFIMADMLNDNADFMRSGKPFEAAYLRGYGKEVREWTRRELGYQ